MLPIRNTERAVGTMLGHEVTLRHGENGLPAGSIEVTLTGSAGQSLGAFLPGGITLRLEGDSNDYVGKGLSGGQIIVRPTARACSPAERTSSRATSSATAPPGQLFIRGIVGERFLVRNSGATAVVEGVGDHALEYMTGGLAVILGGTGRNLGAGMSGGTAYVYELKRGAVNRDSLASGELELLALGSADRRDRARPARTAPRRDRFGARRTHARRLRRDASRFRQGPAARLRGGSRTRQNAVDEGLDPDGDVVWTRILEVTGG